ncbi:DNA polymerase III subunit delta' [bacterium]|nr:DNA polymerase III subunit delta' [bacterium]
MAFKDILGNQRVKKILKRSLKKQKVPHSLIFSGPPGVGKKEMALILAKALNCLKETEDACEVCPNCGAINKGHFPDVLEIQPEKEVIKIEQMRMMKEVAHLKPMGGRKKFFAVNEAEKMSEEASNSLLKILEEPPSFSHVVLVTSNPYLLLPTIRSRCQQLDFSPISPQDIEKILKERGYKEERAKVISLLVQGNMNRALSLEWEEIQEKRNQAWNFFLSFVEKKEKITPFIDDFLTSSSNQREELKQFLEIFASFCRDFLLIKEKGGQDFLINLDYEGKIKDVSESWSTEQTVHLLEKIDSMIYSVERNLNINLLKSSLLSNYMEWKYV